MNITENVSSILDTLQLPEEIYTGSMSVEMCAKNIGVSKVFYINDSKSIRDLIQYLELRKALLYHKRIEGNNNEHNSR